ncbi:MAG: PDZ domain-containing protein [Actinomycetota bacterium]|nr:PDZ domain-containing protein [Actinomycetota bacterium]
MDGDDGARYGHGPGDEGNERRGADGDAGAGAGPEPAAADDLSELSEPEATGPAGVDDETAGTDCGGNLEGLGGDPYGGDPYGGDLEGLGGDPYGGDPYGGDPYGGDLEGLGGDPYDDVDLGAFKGWVSPEDRLWRHPSELGSALRPGSSDGSTRRGPVRPTTRPRAPRKPAPPWVVGTVAVAAGVLLATGLALASSGADPSLVAHRAVATASSSAAGSVPATTVPGTPGPGPAVVSRVEHQVRPSLVALVVHRAGGTVLGTGVVVEPGGIVATTASLLRRATSVVAEEAGGTREPARLVGIDRTSGIAVLRVANQLPAVAVDASDPSPGSVALAVAFPASGSAVPRPAVYAGAVVASGVPAGVDGPTTTFASTVVRVPLTGSEQGGALVDANGRLVGILDTVSSTPSGSVGVFLPSVLVSGVAQQLVASGTVGGGWLGVDGSDLTAPAGSASAPPVGVRVDAVDPGDAAARAGMQAGDVIVAVDGRAVHSMAELRALLYPDPPGTSLEVTVERGSTSFVTTVVLGSSAPAASAAP